MEVESRLVIDNLRGQEPPMLVPGSAPLSFSSFIGGATSCPTVMDSSWLVYLTSGRMAIARALSLNNIGPDDEVLVPAYHCSSMVAPVIHSGAKAIFYRIHEDMSIDLEDIEQKTTNRTRLLLIAHYFGFPQPVELARRFCDKNNILLLEDCAHALFSNRNEVPLGTVGDYSVGSLMKFFPVNDGGFLSTNGSNPFKMDTLPGGRGFELRTALNTIEKSFLFNRLKMLEILLWLPLKLKNLLWRWLKSHQKEFLHNSSPAASDGGFDFEPEWINTRISSFSSRITRLVSTNRIVDRRIRNYHWLSDALASLPNSQRLSPELPEGVVPYVFPLIVEQVDPAFVNLRKRGVPLMRWEFLDDGVNNNTCEISFYYSRHLVQIPCHQELRQEELEWMVDNIRQELSKKSRGD